MSSKIRKKVPDGLSRNSNSEKTVAHNLLNGFTIKGSRGEAIIQEILGCNLEEVTLNGLITVATFISDLGHIRLERNYKRKKALIVKWFNDNEEKISVYKNFVKIAYN